MNLGLLLVASVLVPIAAAAATSCEFHAVVLKQGQAVIDRPTGVLCDEPLDVTFDGEYVAWMNSNRTFEAWSVTRQSREMVAAAVDGVVAEGRAILIQNGALEVRDFNGQENTSILPPTGAEFRGITRQGMGWATSTGEGGQQPRIWAYQAVRNEWITPEEGIALPSVEAQYSVLEGTHQWLVVRASGHAGLWVLAVAESTWHGPLDMNESQIPRDATTAALKGDRLWWKWQQASTESGANVTRPKTASITLPDGTHYTESAVPIELPNNLRAVTVEVYRTEPENPARNPPQETTPGLLSPLLGLLLLLLTRYRKSKIHQGKANFS